MRLHFPQGERKDALLNEGETSIGFAPGSDVEIKGDGVVESHAVITVDARGPVLWVRSPDAWTHVNGRPVREKAMLRVGDLISLGSVTLMLKPDNDASISQHVPPAAEPQEAMSESGNETHFRVTPPKALLRGVSGPYFGKVLAVPGRLVIGRGSDCDLVLDEPEMSRKHAMIEVTAAGIYLRDMGSANGTYVNGVQVRDAVLYSGDQIAFDRNRFLIEAPGMPTRADGQYQAEQLMGQKSATPQSTQAMPAVPVQQSHRQSTSSEPLTGGAPAPIKGSNSPWLPLLIGIAIAAALVLLLLGFRQS
ncbi:MAG: FHA domain-containing protein [Pseudomonadota bacterium]|nr:FHA domain-containing protein [Pseudomonadota bacterium]